MVEVQKIRFTGRISAEGDVGVRDVDFVGSLIKEFVDGVDVRYLGVC